MTAKQIGFAVFAAPYGGSGCFMLLMGQWAGLVGVGVALFIVWMGGRE